MDLTPPSLTRSPASSTHTYCPSERSSLDYPSPDLSAQQYKLASLYAAGQLCSLGQAAEADTSLPPLDSTATTEWTTPDVMAPASSSLSIPNVLSSEYDPFSEYDPPVVASYGSETYPPPPSHSSSVGNPPHSLADATGRSPAPSSTRSSFSYTHGGHSAAHLGTRIKMENVNDYGSGVDVSHYPSPRSMQAPYMTEPGHYASPHQSYLSDSHSPAWSKSELDADAYYQNQPTGESSPPYHNSSKRVDQLKHSRPKRASRRMTTAADANYQCEVKGCGKLFSRSYNYKAHLETHDEKREYPFPCPVADCNKKFVRKTDLQRHNQSVHMKERNHKCDYCSRLFARKDTLRRHMEDGCSKRFDVGTCDLRIDGYEGVGAINRSVGGSAHPLVPAHGTLPPITMPMDTSNGLLHPASSANRSRSVMSGTSDGGQSDSWPR
ncbi:epithelial zinc-finger EZF protein [Colletotrichum truncatum]|uniref:Epithelial zinc-finger EZF protein n=1 Tax=Colletotrichum truncatum TaxID=5467 RepID=A0ACC3ZAF7_COLTU|nr:epithelial zinc-finger EZF protein [Colletotrichum truncatum]KAF6795955.1 epithelial zinc-finger EZF protein [Colletotrichum truncatum]